MLIVLMFSFTACFDTQEKEKTQEDNDNGDDSGDDNGEMGGDYEAIYCRGTLVLNLSEEPTDYIVVKKAKRFLKYLSKTKTITFSPVGLRMLTLLSRTISLLP